MQKTAWNRGRGGRPAAFGACSATASRNWVANRCSYAIWKIRRRSRSVNDSISPTTAAHSERSSRYSTSGDRPLICASWKTANARCSTLGGQCSSRCPRASRQNDVTADLIPSSVSDV